MGKNEGRKGQGEVLCAIKNGRYAASPVLSFFGESLVQCSLPPPIFYTASISISKLCSKPLSTRQAHAKHTAARGSALTRSRSA